MKIQVTREENRLIFRLRRNTPDGVSLSMSDMTNSCAYIVFFLVGSVQWFVLGGLLPFQTIPLPYNDDRNAEKADLGLGTHTHV